MITSVDIMSESEKNMDYANKWFVVYFLNDSLQGAGADYSVIPKSWLTVIDQKYFCKWPKTKKVTTNVLHKGENLQENTYNLFSVNLCFNGVPFDNFEMAQRKLQNIMDSESESGIVNLGRGKRRKTKASHFDELPFNITSSDNESDDGSSKNIVGNVFNINSHQNHKTKDDLRIHDFYQNLNVSPVHDEAPKSYTVLTPKPSQSGSLLINNPQITVHNSRYDNNPPHETNISLDSTTQFAPSTSNISHLVEKELFASSHLRTQIPYENCYSQARYDNVPEVSSLNASIASHQKVPAITLNEIYKEVVKQNMYYESINSKLDMLSLQIKKQEVSKEYSIEDFNEIIQYIPLNSVDMLNSIEQKINDDSGSFNTKMEAYISVIGGTCSKNHIRRILPKLFTDSFAIHCSWTGRGQDGNLRICDLVLTKLLKKVIKIKQKCTDIEFEKVVQDWFRTSKTRFDRAKKTP